MQGIGKSAHNVVVEMRVMEGAVENARIQIGRVADLSKLIGPTQWNEPSRCEAWTISDVYGHLATDFERFGEWLEESLAGATDPPFPLEQLGADNAARLEQLTGVPGPSRVAVFARAASVWLARAETLDPQTPQRHPRGAITVGTQLWWAATECAIHGWDIATALAIPWDPPAAAASMAERYPVPLPDGEPEPWRAILIASGRDA